MKKKHYLVFLFSLFMMSVYSQSEEGYGSGYKLNFDDDGTKYLRIIAWG